MNIALKRRRSPPPPILFLFPLFSLFLSLANVNHSAPSFTNGIHCEGYWLNLVEYIQCIFLYCLLLLFLHIVIFFSWGKNEGKENNFRIFILVCFLYVHTVCNDNNSTYKLKCSFLRYAVIHHRAQVKGSKLTSKGPVQSQIYDWAVVLLTFVWIFNCLRLVWSRSIAHAVNVVPEILICPGEDACNNALRKWLFFTVPLFSERPKNWLLCR